MSDNKKYYYLKLKDNFFDSDQMIVLESMPDGYKYSNILLKLYLRSLRYGGKLMLSSTIPFNSQMLANVTRHSVGDIEKAVTLFQDLKLIDVVDNGAIYMTEIQNFIGSSSTEADRKREYRKQIEQDKRDNCLEFKETNVPKNSGQMSPEMGGQMSQIIVDKCPNNENGQMSTQMSGQMSTQTNGQMSGQMSQIIVDKCPNNEKRQMSGQMSTQMSGQMSQNGQMSDKCPDKSPPEIRDKRLENKQLQQQHGYKFKQEKSGGGENLSFYLEKWLDIKSASKKNPSAYRASLKNKFEKDKKSVKEEFADWLQNYKATDQKKQIEEKLQKYKNRKIVTNQGTLEIIAIELLEDFRVKLFFESGNFSIVENLEALKQIQIV